MKFSLGRAILIRGWYFWSWNGTGEIPCLRRNKKKEHVSVHGHSKRRTFHVKSLWEAAVAIVVVIVSATVALNITNAKKEKVCSRAVSGATFVSETLHIFLRIFSKPFSLSPCSFPRFVRNHFCFRYPFLLSLSLFPSLKSTSRNKLKVVYPRTHSYTH